MSTEDLEQYEADLELQLYKEYKDVAPMFSFVVETERRFYLCNGIEQSVHDENGRSWVPAATSRLRAAGLRAS